MTKHSITLDSVNMHYNSTGMVLETVNLTVPENSLVQIRGSSGSGKSTLLHIIAGLTKPDSGKVYLHGSLANDPNILIPPHKRRISLLFQDLALWPHMKGYAQLALVSGNNETHIAEICDQIQLPKELLSKYPSQLSGGEQQRLAIARALCAKPKILLLDEPFTALDQENRNALVTYLNNIKNKLTVLLISHELLSINISPDLTYYIKDKTLTLG